MCKRTMVAFIHPAHLFLPNKENSYVYRVACTRMNCYGNYLLGGHLMLCLRVWKLDIKGVNYNYNRKQLHLLLITVSIYLLYSFSSCRSINYYHADYPRIHDMMYNVMHVKK